MTTITARQCPQCTATLQQLSGPDGWPVELTVDSRTHRRVLERRRHATIYACPGCDYFEDGKGEAQ